MSIHGVWELVMKPKRDYENRNLILKGAGEEGKCGPKTGYQRQEGDQLEQVRGEGEREGRSNTKLV